ncbi:MAG: peptidase S41 [Desulfuromonas sp.]|nr:MAG: peptidase S41 [Desulfuromonas sp.]
MITYCKKILFILALQLSLLMLLPCGVMAEDASRRGDEAYRELELFTDVLALIQRNYVEEVELKDLIYGAIDGMLATLDPHSSFMPPEEYVERQVDTQGAFGGLGLEVTIRDGVLTVVSPIDDTPAFRAGLMAGDQIVRIEGDSTKTLDIMDAVQLMRGEPGTVVSIEVMRETFEKPQLFELTREVIKIASVKSRSLAEGVGYVRLLQFQEKTAEDLKKALKGLRKENEGVLKGLVLDLRNNPGGLLDQAIQVSDLFIDEGLIVYTEGRDEESRISSEATKEGTEPSYPMVILINAGSASASEIVAGALRDHERALLLGERSFGKGSVQTLMPLGDDSGLSLTTARYFTPKGISIQATGIEPDILVPQAELVVRKGAHYREQDLSNHILNGNGDAVKGHEQTSPQFHLSPEDLQDYPLMRALDLLQGWEVFRQYEPALQG